MPFALKIDNGGSPIQNAWKALGHKVIAEIARQQLDGGQRADIVRALRRHRRFDADFACNMPDNDQDRWISQHAVTGNLQALWDNLLGRGDRTNDVLFEVAFARS
jgi:hypothetical protein